MATKQYKLKKEEIIELVPATGSCYATDKITVEGLNVGFMYREEPDDDKDSGWRFLSGTEDEEYMDDPEHSRIYALNTIANYDRSIIRYLDFPVGTEFERIDDTDEFQLIKNNS